MTSKKLSSVHVCILAVIFLLAVSGCTGSSGVSDPVKTSSEPPGTPPGENITAPSNQENSVGPDVENNNQEQISGKKIEQPPKAKSSSVTKLSSSEPAAEDANNAINAEQVKQISARDLHNMLTTAKGPVIIDISTPGEFREGHIRDSLLGDMRLLRSQPEQYLDSLK